jgi:hypothetical protein
VHGGETDAVERGRRQALHRQIHGPHAEAAATQPRRRRRQTERLAAEFIGREEEDQRRA